MLPPLYARLLRTILRDCGPCETLDEISRALGEECRSRAIGHDLDVAKGLAFAAQAVESTAHAIRSFDP